MSTTTGFQLTSLVLQPGASFVTNEAGFDTGTRTFICDNAHAAALEPSVGIPDSEVFFRNSSSVLEVGVYPWMFVTKVTTTLNENGLATISVEYKGQKTKFNQSLPTWLKRAHTENAFESQQVNFDGTQLTIALPVAVITYLAMDSESLLQMNTQIAAPNGQTPSLVYEGITIPTPAYAAWRITGRKISPAGIPRVSGKRSLLEIVDNVSYTLGFTT